MSQYTEETKSNIPKPDCTFADHSYPAYSRKMVEGLIAQRDELLAALVKITDMDFSAYELRSIAREAIAKAVQP